MFHQMTVLLDGDIIAYQSSASADGRVYKVDGLEFKYKKDAVEHCVLTDTDANLIELSYVHEPEQNALHNVKLSVQSIVDRFPGCKLEVFLTGNTIFRNEFVTDYKANRSGMHRPHWLNSCKQYLLNKYKAKLVEGFEADDLIGIRATELGPGRFIVASIDKDLDMIAGLHYNWRKDEEYVVSEVESIKRFYSQLLTGDSTDNIKGISGIGPKKAEKILEGLSTNKDMYLGTMDAWIEAEGYCGNLVDALTKMHTAALLLWILREESTLWKPPALS